jgi:hypothetical protein
MQEALTMSTNLTLPQHLALTIPYCGVFTPRSSLYATISCHSCQSVQNTDVAESPNLDWHCQIRITHCRMMLTPALRGCWTRLSLAFRPTRKPNQASSRTQRKNVTAQSSTSPNNVRKVPRAEPSSLAISCSAR